jgi:hypothetical protein
MNETEIRIVRPWGRRGSRYEVDAAGIFYYRLAWAAAALSVASIPLHAMGLLPIFTWLAIFPSALALTACFTWNATRHGRKLPD